MTRSGPVSARGRDDDFPTFQLLLTRCLARYPERVALVDGAERITGRQLHERVMRTVAAYASLGLDRNSRIALLSANSADYLVAQFAAVVLGACYTGLHPMASPDALAGVLRALRPQALVFGPGDSAAKVDAIRAEWPDCPIAFLSLGPAPAATDLLARAAAAPDPDVQAPPVPAGHPASISFTSGTTGAPKGVVRSQRAIACSVLTMLAEWDWPNELRFLALAPLTHATGSIVPAVLLRGGTVHIRPGFDVADVHDQVRAERITATFLVPTMIYRMLDGDTGSDADLASLRMLLYGAAAMSPGRLEEGLRRWGKIFVQLYGQVEAPNTICTLRAADHRVDDPARLASCGKATLAIDVALHDSEGSPVPTGTAGEICVRGPLVMDGYLDDPDATAAALRDGWLRTGDLAVADADGFLTIVDRLKDMIVSGGFNIFAGEVERTLASSPLVRECAVIGTPDELWGEAVTAYVIPTTASVDPDALSTELTRHVRAARGPAWSPKRVHVVGELPLTPLGKPDKAALRARHWVDTGRAVH